MCYGRVLLLLLQGLIIKRHDPFDYYISQGSRRGKEFSFEAEKCLRCLSFPRQRDVFLYI